MKPCKKDVVEGKRKRKAQEINLEGFFSAEDYTVQWGNERNIDECSPYADLRKYLNRVATFIDWYGYNHPTISQVERTAIYHMNGATLKLDYSSFVETLCPVTMSAKIDLQIVSDDQADIVIERLQKRFPYLERKG